MSQAAEDIERIVRDVLARLNGAAPAAEPKSAAPAECLEITSKIVSLEEVRGRLNGARQLVVARGAIVTPAVRDLLREKQIELAYAAADERNRQAAPLIVGVAETNFDPSPLLRLVEREGIAVQRVACVGLAAVVDELADQIVRGGSAALLLTSETHAALCLANRHRGVRAIAAADVRCVQAALPAVGPNFLIMNPAGHALYALKLAVSAFCKGHPAKCPEPYRERLG